ncbi:MAG: hypothetical protein JWR13_4333, partial [Mycobacterium sp.]|nr:hypothetical protein [Mycobacterium sp.]
MSSLPVSEDYDVPGYVTGLMRHFDDLRDNTHGGVQGRHDQEEHFIHSVD